MFIYHCLALFVVYLFVGRHLVIKNELI